MCDIEASVRAKIPASAPAGPAAPTDADIAAALGAYRTKYEAAGAPALGVCSVSPGNEHDQCVVGRYQFAHWDWRWAQKGEITAARNVVFCLSTGCHGAVRAQPIRGCAWSLLITTSGSPDQIGTDADRATMSCRSLSPGEQALARSQAAKLATELPELRNIPAAYDEG